MLLCKRGPRRWLIWAACRNGTLGQRAARTRAKRKSGTEKVNKSALSERDAALKEKLDRFLDKAKAELGQLTELFPDREGPDDPSVVESLDDATMNQLLKNLIAKLLNKDFPGYGRGCTGQANWPNALQPRAQGTAGGK
jgi:hypothetical protein